MDASQKAQKNPTLLLADDSVTIQKVIELTFADQGVRVVAVGDGDAAIALVEQAPPDIVLADVGMPGKSGYEVSRYIKQSSRLAHIPVLLLTGAFDPLDQIRAREAGCDGVLEKPFEPQAVIGRVRELLGLPQAPPSKASAGSAEHAQAEATAAADAANAPTVAQSAGAGPAPPETATGPVPAAQPSPSASDPEGALAAVPVMAQTPAAAATAPMTPAAPMTLASAFAALLAAEQHGNPTDATSPWLPAAPAVTDELVEQVAQRVLDRLSKDVVRETVSDVVSGVAERLVAEEIERIKASIK